jgi:hypothetical protein
MDTTDTLNQTAQDRLRRDMEVDPPEQPVPVTSDGFATSLDVHGIDVVDVGMSSDASVRGMGVDLDSMPGDETPIASSKG